MIDHTSRKIVISICGFILIYLVLMNGRITHIFDTPCDEYQCWLEKKEELNKNIARVCRKYRGSIKLAGTPATMLRRFLHVDQMVNCINEKVIGG